MYTKVNLIQSEHSSSLNAQDWISFKCTMLSLIKTSNSSTDYDYQNKYVHLTAVGEPGSVGPYLVPLNYLVSLHCKLALSFMVESGSPITQTIFTNLI